MTNGEAVAVLKIELLKATRDFYGDRRAALKKAIELLNNDKKREVRKMNKVELIGRLTRDPDVLRTQDDKVVARFTLAVDREYKREETDFIRCVCFGKTAEHVEKYYTKGLKVAITGRIQTGSYQDKDGKTVYTTDVIVESCEFVESKKEQRDDDFMPTPAGLDGLFED